MRLLLGEIVPLAETIRLERAVAAVEHNLGVALKQECQRTARGADIDRLPKAVEHQHMLVEHGTHKLIPTSAILHSHSPAVNARAMETSWFNVKTQRCERAKDTKPGRII